jgi:hypothetical protein
MTPNEITTRQAMALTNWSRQWIYYLIWTGRVKSTRYGPTHMIDRGSLMRYFRSERKRGRKTLCP